MYPFDLEPCFDWIAGNNVHNVCLYFLSEFYDVSAEVCTVLQERFNQVNFIVIISSSGGVDTIATRIKNESAAPDSVIYFGANCLCETRHSGSLPTLFIPRLIDDSTIDFIKTNLEQNCKSDELQTVLLVSDYTNCLVLQAQNRSRMIANLNCQLEVVRFAKPPVLNWTFPDICQEFFDQQAEPLKAPNALSHYHLVVFVGECNNLEFQLKCPRMLLLQPSSQQCTIIDGPREFRKRVSLIEKFKSQAKHSIGIVFHNYNQSVSPIMARCATLCKRIKRIPFYISLNQPDIQLRLGNFGQLEGFVLITPCECIAQLASSSSRYLYPIIFWKEFLIACNEKLTYGDIHWNEHIDHDQIQEQEDEEDEPNDEENMKLVDREFYRKPDSWYGLVVDAGSKPIEDIKDGQSGRAAHYDNEQELF